MQLIIIISCVLAMIALTFNARSDDKPIVGILTLSTFYYAAFGLLYWIYVRRGFFVGFYWPIEDLKRAGVILAITSAALATLIVMAGYLTPGVKNAVFDPRKAAASVRFLSEPVFNFFLALGLCTSLFVLAKGSFSSSNDPTARGGLFLVAYQFSDILVATICYDIARRGFQRENMALTGYFLFYAVLVGFRYKIALIAIPLALCLLHANIPAKRKLMFTATSSLGVLILFSLMTLFRSKFGVPDFSRDLNNPGDQLIYGLFAEANIIFGFSSVIRVHVDQDLIYLFQPIVDAFKELLPRFLFPERTSGEYVRPMVLGMLSKQGLESATTYPWIGEFCIMFGKLGPFIGPPAMAGLYIALKGAVVQFSRTREKALMGIFLIAGMIGYYHFGRGYTPQLFKAYLFIIAPYILMCVLVPAKAFAARRTVTGTAFSEQI